jgi:hypothetical protein
MFDSPLSSSGDQVCEVAIQHSLRGDNAGFIVKTELRLSCGLVLELSGPCDKIRKTASFITPTSTTKSFLGKEAMYILLFLTGHEYGSGLSKVRTAKILGLNSFNLPAIENAWKTERSRYVESVWIHTHNLGNLERTVGLW